MSGWQEELGWQAAPQPRRRPQRMSWAGCAAAALIPVVAQLLAWWQLAQVDACTNNPGCMAGSISLYALVLLIAPCTLLFPLAALAEKASRRVSVETAVLIHTIVALVPFAALFAII